ncbi:TetR/AcrR family transcriptional regulator [Motilibacter deserti]|uniref:TetR/AcrR family transcriptional regulator n=1 Tax=Motilibacter deserti TaxID=2714956 RepID=A0ABX0GS99_9ACTN|nr:TetR/AcrR family transcriptional regulator [Motilibacter deserti]NHC13642.1 TetR/AcrR family transcriptional regulator [Motilibacter deserti]
MARPRTTSDEQIFTATGEALRRHGLSGTTLAAVAREAGMSSAGLVQRFGSKRALLLAFAERAADATGACFAQARQRTDCALEALHEGLAALTEGLDSPAQLANSLGFLQLDVADEEFRRHAAANARRVESELEALLGEAVDARELDDGAEPQRLAHSVYVAYNGALVLWPLLGQAPLRDELRAAVDAVLLPHRPARPTRALPKEANA